MSRARIEKSGLVRAAALSKLREASEQLTALRATDRDEKIWSTIGAIENQINTALRILEEDDPRAQFGSPV